MHYSNLKLLPGDRVIVPKSGVNAVQHHAIYAGNGWFYENLIGRGVVLTHYSQFFAGIAKITAIKRFKGNDYQRHLAINRAKEHHGRAYDLLNYNCEHFATYVQNGHPSSTQVDRTIGISILGLIFLALTKATIKA